MRAISAAANFSETYVFTSSFRRYTHRVSIISPIRRRSTNYRLIRVNDAFELEMILFHVQCFTRCAKLCGLGTTTFFSPFMNRTNDILRQQNVIKVLRHGNEDINRKR